MSSGYCAEKKIRQTWKEAIGMDRHGQTWKLDRNEKTWSDLDRHEQEWRATLKEKTFVSHSFSRMGRL